ncbi:MAG: hypothetical protein HFI86_06510 [Bacilli bacterium]|nr:hypothetical protein [Bacilli bacterium]
MPKINVKLNYKNESSMNGYNRLQETEDLLRDAIIELQKEDRKKSLQQRQIKTKETNKKVLER